MNERTPVEHAIAEIRTASVCIIAILRKYDIVKTRTLLSTWYDVGEEVKRIEKAREVIKAYL